jgi:hypothetical protein
MKPLDDESEAGAPSGSMRRFEGYMGLHGSEVLLLTYGPRKLDGCGWRFVIKMRDRQLFCK